MIFIFTVTQRTPKSKAGRSSAASDGYKGQRLVFGKLLNGGQLCLSPDYVLVPEELEEQLIARVVDETQSMYANITENTDYAGVFE